MKKYFLHIAYNGSQYRGWQRQPKVISVQEVFEEILEKMLGKPTVAFGCGRTDAEVHASQYFLHLETDEAFDYDPVFRLNKMLPPDIVVYEVIEMDLKNHARYQANRRTYNYFLHSFKDPFLRSLSTECNIPELDLHQMQLACNLFLKHKDFRALCRTPDKHNHTLCEVDTAQLYVDKNRQRLRFEVASNRFLRGMIRLMIAKLIEVGKGKTSVAALDELLTDFEGYSDERAAFPQGLYLTKVEYPYLSRPTRNQFAFMMHYKMEGYWEAVSS